MEELDMSNQEMAGRAAENLKTVREKKPLIHNITNYVVMNYTANALLACGASPVMAHAIEEVEEMVSLASALVLNIGTLSTHWIDAMVKAGRRANKLGIPVILDPVGSGATVMRTKTAKLLIEEVSIQVIRGNASEVLSLAPATASSSTKGVDSVHTVDEATEVASDLARELKTILAITGAVDLVTDGQKAYRVKNGHEMMGCVTGTGCTATAIIAAFLAVDRNALDATTTALAYFGLAGEMAAVNAPGPGTFGVGLLDVLYNMKAEELLVGTRIS
jgi:hydroxyethylthiazole kinase